MERKRENILSNGTLNNCDVALQNSDLELLIYYSLGRRTSIVKM